MAKTKKKNNNYGGAKPVEKKDAAQQPAPTMQYGIPGWLVLICLVMLVGALLLQSKVEGTGALATVTYFLTGIPALILSYGQKKVKDETDNKMATGLFWIFTIIAVLYLFSGVTSLGNLLRA